MEMTREGMTIPKFFLACAEKFEGNVYLRENRGSGYAGTTYKQVLEQVKRFAAGLYALGLRKGDRVVLLSEARNEWVIGELAILFCGAVNVPLATRMTEPPDLVYRINHSGARMAVVSGNLAGRIRSLRNETPALEMVILLDETSDRGEKEILYNDILAEGDALLASDPGVTDRLLEELQPGDPANISYTSGTTADPKGIILTHSNYIANIFQGYSLMDITPDFVTLLILPWDHAFAHTAGIYCFMGKGASIASVQQGRTTLETLKNLPVNIRELRPQLLFTVPAIAKNFRKNIERGIEAKGAFPWWLFRLALGVAYFYNGLGYNRGKGVRLFAAPLAGIFDRMIFRKVRDAFGGRMQMFIGGGALLDIELQRFFYAIGIPMLQGYGLTEAAPLISANALHRHKLGSSGRLVSNLEVRISDDDGHDLPVGEKGEIVVRGANVMAGYWNNPEATAEAIRDGWLHTGDLGYLDKDGFLYVLGRFKSLLIADDGEKYSPEGMEEAFVAQSEFIEQCMLYNNQDPYTILLLYPDRTRLASWLSHHHQDHTEEKAIEHALEKLVNEIRQYRAGGRFDGQFPQRWLPAAIGILDQGFTEDNHLLNFQLKIVRGKVTERYGKRIRFLYTPEGKSILNTENMAAMQSLLFSKDRK